MKLSIDHITDFTYDTEVTHSIQYLRLTPQSSAGQQILNWHLDAPGSVHRTLDTYGNILHVCTVDQPHQGITIRAQGTAEISEEDQPERENRIPPQVFLRTSPLTEPSEAIREFARGFRPAGERLHTDRHALIEMMAALLERIPYRSGMTHAHSSATDAFAQGFGVCQDHSHIFIACCRWLGIPARYVSGYVDAGDDQHIASHAWAEAWVDDAWYSFDVSNGLATASHHLKLAHGIDYLDASPVRGIRWGGGAENMHAYALVDQVDRRTAQSKMQRHEQQQAQQ
ncbi:transglutaminase family protein [Microbulbifer salipaludis]|uniref:Transglutaminase family protein n=1 Tax=Microbulbifer salipaludis TaxID=187980 RepID=A0ABS3E7N8_9GAMM|nr:transglutaminase family protein [Microbulbifer salipaludis]MBN8431267.1 transglutaminase family protein [Microbulbifer salipaludis]